MEKSKYIFFWRHDYGSCVFSLLHIFQWLSRLIRQESLQRIGKQNRAVTQCSTSRYWRHLILTCLHLHKNSPQIFEINTGQKDYWHGQPCWSLHTPSKGCQIPNCFITTMIITVNILTIIKTHCFTTNIKKLSDVFKKQCKRQMIDVWLLP